MEELAQTPLIDPEIPNKLYFRIGEVAKLAGIKPYVLRFWESEFNGLGPKKSGSGHRLYRRKDVEMVLEIKRLLYEKRFTIEGARKVLEVRPKKGEPAVKPSITASSTTSPKRGKVQPSQLPLGQGELFGGTSAFYQEMRKELAEVLDILKTDR